MAQHTPQVHLCATAHDCTSSWRPTYLQDVGHQRPQVAAQLLGQAAEEVGRTLGYRFAGVAHAAAV